MDDRTAEITLRTIADSLQLLTAVVKGSSNQGMPVVLITARGPDGQTYRASAPTMGQAVAAFADAVGFELEDG